MFLPIEKTLRDFVRKLKDLPSGVSDISVSPRIVYLDKDRTLDNVD
jgi:hypothetical protein